MDPLRSGLFASSNIGHDLTGSCDPLFARGAAQAPDGGLLPFMNPGCPPTAHETSPRRTYSRSKWDSSLEARETDARPMAVPASSDGEARAESDDPASRERRQEQAGRDTRRPGANGGGISLVLGPMFSGKSTTIFSALERAAEARLPSLLVLFEEDRRYGSDPQTHAGHTLRQQEHIRVVRARRLDEVPVPPEVVVIAVDEGQFYPDLAETCESWAARGLYVYVAALDGSFARLPFAPVNSLIPLCTSITKNLAICMHCRRRPAPFTRRLVASDKEFLIGNSDSYEATCRACWALPDTGRPPSPAKTD